MTTNRTDGGPRESRLLTRHVAEAVAAKLAAAGVTAFTARALETDRDLSRRDFAALGLNSVDWMDVATQIEDALGIELPDEMLLDAGNRSVAGWSDHLRRLFSTRSATTAREAETGTAPDAEVNDATNRAR